MTGVESSTKEKATQLDVALEWRSTPRETEKEGRRMSPGFSPLEKQPQSDALPLMEQLMLLALPRNVAPLLFIVARTWRQPKCPSTEEWIQKI